MECPLSNTKVGFLQLTDDLVFWFQEFSYTVLGLSKVVYKGLQIKSWSLKMYTFFFFFLGVFLFVLSEVL